MTEEDKGIQFTPPKTLVEYYQKGSTSLIAPAFDPLISGVTISFARTLREQYPELGLKEHASKFFHQQWELQKGPDTPETRAKKVVASIIFLESQ